MTQPVMLFLRACRGAPAPDVRTSFEAAWRTAAAARPSRSDPRRRSAPTGIADESGSRCCRETFVRLKDGRNSSPFAFAESRVHSIRRVGFEQRGSPGFTACETRPWWMEARLADVDPPDLPGQPSRAGAMIRRSACSRAPRSTDPSGQVTSPKYELNFARCLWNETNVCGLSCAAKKGAGATTGPHLTSCGGSR